MGTKISALTEVTAPATSDVVPIVSGGATKKVKVQNLRPALNFINASDYGLSTSASASANATALSNAIAASLTAKQPLALPPGTFDFSGLTVTDKVNLTLAGLTRVGEISNTKLRYTGSGTALLLDRLRESELGKFELRSNDGTRRLAVGIDIDQLVGTGSNISTHNRFYDIQIYNATIGIRIANVSTSNNELHIFERVYPRLDSFTTGLAEAGTIAWLIEDVQSKFHLLRDCYAGFADIGLKLVTGSFLMDGRFNFTHNNTDILILAASEPIVITSPQSEQAKRFLDVQNATDGKATITVYGGRLDPTNVHADGQYIKYVKPGCLTFIGTDFSNGNHVAAWRIFIQSGLAGTRTSATFIGCTFPNNTPFEGQPQLQKLTVLNCQYTESGGGRKAFPDRLGPGIQIHPDVLVKTANYSMTLADNVILVNTASGPVTITLPDITFDDTPTGIDAGHIVKIKNIGAATNDVTLAGAGGGIPEITTLNDGESVELMYEGPSVGPYWRVMAKY